MNDFKINSLTSRVTRITAPCGEMMYLLEGSEKAALIDSGLGFGSLLEAVRELTQKPVILLLTHGHVDHAMGAEEFGEVWMSPLDREIFLRHSDLSVRKNELAISPLAKRGADWTIQPAADPDRFHPLEAGSRFDLGGVTLETFPCPGHTPGSMVFLCPEERILFSGDAFSNSTLLLDPAAPTVEEYLETLLALAPRLAGRFDRVLEAHTTGELPPDILEGVIAVCREVLRGESQRILCEFRGLSGVFAKKQDPVTLGRADGGVGNLLYDENRLYRKK